jgi:hypothetical protein
MKNFIILVLLSCTSFMAFPTIYYHSGTISSDITWNAADTHYVCGNVIVASGVTLTIEAGALITINCVPAVPPGSTVTYGIRVNGVITAIGTPSNYITFTPSNTSSGNGWKGIQFTTSNRDQSTLKYCILEYAWKPSTATISVNNCGAALYIENRNTVTVEYCKIRYSSAYTGGGIYIGDCAPTIKLNEIYENEATLGGGIHWACSSATNGSLLNNLIYKNEASTDGGGVYCANVNLSLNYCTVADNSAGSSDDGGGLYIGGGSKTARNSILYGNTPDQAYPTPDNTNYNYCCIENLSSPINGNINDDPQFVDASSNDYRISDMNNSPCIDEGDNSVSYTTYDIYGNNRNYDYPYRGTYVIDIGAHENIEESCRKLGESIFSINEKSLTIYPNPTEYDYSTILLRINEDSDVLIEIINFQGQIIQRIENQLLSIGDHVYFINTEKLNSGIYFVNYRISNELYCKKLIVL